MQPPQAPPPGNDSDEGQESEGGASEAIQDIQEGFQKLSQMMQAAQGQVSPQDMKLFQAAVQATDAFVQSISGPAQKAPPGGPMPHGASAGAMPVPNQG